MDYKRDYKRDYKKPNKSYKKTTVRADKAPAYKPKRGPLSKLMSEDEKVGAGIHELSYDFGCRITRLFQYLTEDAEYKEFIQSKQIYRNGTSVGANVRESKHAQSDADFLSKMSIAYKEADETDLYKEMVKKVLTDIEFSLNKEMERLNKVIINDEKKPPRISLTPTSYSIFCEDDTGTGTSFRALLIFDIAILNLTALPFLIHDSLLFKNVEDDAIKGMMSVYENENKQVFISIDKVPSYPQDVIDLVEKNKVLKVSLEHPLYGKLWNR